MRCEYYVLLDFESQVHLVSGDFCQKISRRQETSVSGFNKVINIIKRWVLLMIDFKINNFKTGNVYPLIDYYIRYVIKTSVNIYPRMWH